MPVLRFKLMILHSVPCLEIEIIVTIDYVFLQLSGFLT